MRVLIALAEPLPPQASGGSQRVAFEIAAGLRADGDVANVAGRLLVRQRAAAPAVARALAARRHHVAASHDGIPVHRFFRGGRGFAEVLDAAAPDVVLLHAMSAMPLAQVAAARGMPLVIYWHDIEFHKLDGEPPESGARHVANSCFTARRVRDRFGIEAAVIPPIFAQIATSADHGAAATHDRVLFINPVADKGLEIALRVAALCPDIPFEFVESWTLDAGQRAALAARLTTLPNVTLTPHQSDMRPLYARARLLLAPSRWEEAWGRVATEAQAHGLPVIATRIGGLTEATGPGGVLVERGAPAEAWAGVLRKSWNDGNHYAALAAAATRHAARAEVDPTRNLQRLRGELVAAR